MTMLFSLFDMLLPICAVAIERLTDAGLSERHHRHHDTFTISYILTRAIMWGMVGMSVLGIVLGWLCLTGAVLTRGDVVMGFFSSAVVVLFASWAFIRRYKVACYDDRMVVTPFLGGGRTVFFADIDRMEWSGFRKASGYRNLDVYVDGSQVVRLSGTVDIEQVLLHIDRFDVLGHASEA